MKLGRRTRRVLAPVLAMALLLTSGIFGEGTVSRGAETGVWGDYEYETRFDGVETRTYLTKYNGNETDVVTPTEVNGLEVNGIGGTLFNDCDTVVNVTISEKVEYVETSFIYDSIFEGCDKLRTVKLPSTLGWMDNNPFLDCPSLQSVEFPNGSSTYKIESDALITLRGYFISYFGKNRTEYTVPNGVRSFARASFIGSGLETVTIPKGVQEIGENCFDETLKTAIFEGGYSYIEQNSFASSGNQYNVTVKGKSNGILQKKCQEYGITFVSTGEVEKYTVLTKGTKGTGYLYGDEKFYYEFTPDRTTDYIIDVTDECDGMGYPGVCLMKKADGTEVDCQKGELYTYECRLEAGVKYYLECGEFEWGARSFDVLIKEKGKADENQFVILGSDDRGILYREKMSDGDIYAEWTYDEIDLGDRIVIPRNATLRSGDECVVYGIKSRGFCLCPGLKYAEIASGIVKIEEDAFMGCEDLVAAYVPSSVETIESGAFASCSEKLVLYGEVGSSAETYAVEQGIKFSTNISEFRALMNNTTAPVAPATTNPQVVVTPRNTNGTTSDMKRGASVKSGKSIFKVTNTSKAEVSYVKTSSKKASSVTIPATVKSNGKTYKVTSIADNAFKNQKKLKKAIIGNNISKIGKNAFKGIHAKAKINVPKSKFKVYKKLFKEKGQKKSVTIKKK